MHRFSYSKSSRKEKGHYLMRKIVACSGSEWGENPRAIFMALPLNSRLQSTRNFRIHPLPHRC